MEVVNIKDKVLYGLCVRTKNVDEMNPQTAKIGALWQKFASEVAIDYESGVSVYGVYFNYESDMNGSFDVLAGYDGAKDDKLEKVLIQGGKYLVFKEEAKEPTDGARVEAVIKTWGRVWEYFMDDKSEYKRAYTTDFEFYKDATNIEICIAIK